LWPVKYFFVKRKTNRSYLTGEQWRTNCRQFVDVVQQNACYHPCEDNDWQQNAPQISSRHYSPNGNPETGDGGDDHD
jgi:hypothetical protein